MSIPTSPWPRSADCNETTGLQCWGCARRICVKGTRPTKWLEVLCPEPDCPAWAIAGTKPIEKKAEADAD